MFYTYAYLRVNGTPYYIGKGCRYRAWIKNAHERIKPPKDKNRILILKRFTEEADAFKHEIYMIAVLGRKSEGGLLVNLCEGGQGTSMPKTEEHKRKIAESNRGVTRSLETRKRMSEGSKDKPKSLSHKRKISASLKGKPWSPARRRAYELKKQTLNK